MTFSSASRSCLEVEEVAATAAGVIGFRSGAMTRWCGGRAGAAAGGGSAAVLVSLTFSFTFSLAAVAADGVDLGTMLRATGLGRGIGTFFLVCPFSAASADMATANVRPDANAIIRAVDRVKLMRASWVTAFLWRRIALSPRE